MTKKLISYDDEAVGGGLPEVVKQDLNATYPPNSLTAIRVPAAATFTEIQNALTAAKSTGEKVVVGGTITTPYTLTIECDCDLSQLVVNYTGTGTAVRVGTATSVTWRLYVRLPRIRHIGKTDLGWGQVVGTVGVELVNLNSCPVIEIPHVQNFELGLLEVGVNAKGHAYNNVTIGHLDNNKRNCVMRALDTGWSNENQHYGGRFGHNNAEGDSVVDAKHIDLEAADVNALNNNVWHKPSLEGSVNEYALDCAGMYNLILSGRWERPGGAKVRWKDNAVDNMIFGGYAAKFIVSNMSSRNVILAPSRNEMVGTSTRGILQLLNSAGAASPALDILAPLATPDRDRWTWRATARAIFGRRDGETHHRFELNAETGRFLLGNGTAAPTVGLTAYGASGFSPVGNMWFPSGNGPILVSPSGMQRRLRLNDDGTLGVVAV